MKLVTDPMRAEELAKLKERLAWLAADLEHMNPRKRGTLWEADRLNERGYLERTIARLEAMS